MRASDLLSHPGSIVDESQVWTSCAQCKETQWLDQVPVAEDPSVEVVYRCRNGCGPILILRFGGYHGQEGHLLRDWVLYNPSDLYLRPLDGDQETIRLVATSITGP